MYIFRMVRMPIGYDIYQIPSSASNLSIVMVHNIIVILDRHPTLLISMQHHDCDMKLRLQLVEIVKCVGHIARFLVLRQDTLLAKGQDLFRGKVKAVRKQSKANQQSCVSE